MSTSTKSLLNTRRMRADKKLFEKITQPEECISWLDSRIAHLEIGNPELDYLLAFRSTLTVSRSADDDF